MNRIVFFAALTFVGFSILIVIQRVQFYDNRLHVVFCNIGQGDAIFIRTPNGSDILYDGGPSDDVLNCLSKNMPFWDRDIELMILSHPHEDHLRGLISVIESYEVKAFMTEELSNKTASYKELVSRLRTHKIPTKYVLAGDFVRIASGLQLAVLGPSREYIQKTSPGGTIGESAEFASLILHLSSGEFDLLLTGDSQIEGLEEGVEGLEKSIEVLHVPHHGSRFGLGSRLIERINPQLAVISVGKNKYGHPSKEALRLLEEKNTKTLRTDQSGDIEIVSDGKNWRIKQ